MLPFLPEGLHAALSFPLPFDLLIWLPGSHLQLIIYTLARAGGEAARSNGKALASFHLSSSRAQPGSISSEMSSLNNLLISFDLFIFFRALITSCAIYLFTHLFLACYARNMFVFFILTSLVPGPAVLNTHFSVQMSSNPCSDPHFDPAQLSHHTQLPCSLCLSDLICKWGE